jgi:hypothetical protein
MFISRPEEIMVAGKVMKTLNLIIMFTAEKVIILKPITSS